MTGHTLKCLSALLLCAALITCACRADTSIPFLDWLVQEVENSRPIETVEQDATESIWGKKLSYRTSSLPDRAFAEGGRLCAGMAADGRNFLIVNGVMPHFWDIQTGQRTWLYPADEKAEEMMRLYCAPERTQKKMSAEQVEAYYEKRFGGREGFSRLSGKDLLNEYLSAVNGGVPYGPKGYQYVYTDSRYMIVSDQIGAFWAVDTQTGAMYLCDGNCGGVYNGEMLSYQTPAAKVTLTSLETGKTRTVPFSYAYRFEDGEASLSSAAFLPDGSIAAVLRTSHIDVKEGQDCVLAIRTPTGKMETYPLGQLRFGAEPDVAMASDGDGVVLYSRSMVTRYNPYLINRKTGTVSVLASTTLGLTVIPVEQCTFPGGVITLPEAYSKNRSAYPLNRIGDVLVMYNLADARMMLMKPGTAESRYVVDDPAVDSPIPNYFFTDGRSRIMMAGLDGKTIIIDLQ